MLLGSIVMNFPFTFFFFVFTCHAMVWCLV